MQKIQQITEIVQSEMPSRDEDLQQHTDEKETPSPPEETEIRGLDEQQVELITGGGIPNVLRVLGLKTPKTPMANPAYDPNSMPISGAPSVTGGLKSDDPTRIREQDRRISIISERK